MEESRATCTHTHTYTNKQTHMRTEALGTLSPAVWASFLGVSVLSESYLADVTNQWDAQRMGKGQGGCRANRVTSNNNKGIRGQAHGTTGKEKHHVSFFNEF